MLHLAVIASVRSADAWVEFHFFAVVALLLVVNLLLPRN